MAKGLWTILNVENVDKSIEFYKLLGLKARKQTEDGLSWGSVDASPDSGLVLWNIKSIGPNQDQPDLKQWLSGELGKGVLVSIGVPNAKRVWEKVSNMVTIDQPLREEPWGGSSFNVVDPDGYVVSLTDAWPGTSKRAKAKRAPKRTPARASSKAKGKAKPKRKAR